MVVATESFVTRHPDHKGRIGYLITADEEDQQYTVRVTWSKR